jgi:hypothetical protein
MMNIDAVIQKIHEKQHEFKIQLNPPVNASTIAEFESAFELILPNELQAFYKFANGFDTYDFMFRIIPLEDAIEELVKYNHGVKSSEFPFAEYMIYSDTWTVRLKRGNPDAYEIINRNHGTESAVILTDSIVEFVVRYINGGGIFGDDGLYEWFEERKALGY